MHLFKINELCTAEQNICTAVRGVDSHGLRACVCMCVVTFMVTGHGMGATRARIKLLAGTYSNEQQITPLN